MPFLQQSRSIYRVLQFLNLNSGTLDLPIESAKRFRSFSTGAVLGIPFYVSECRPYPGHGKPIAPLSICTLQGRHRFGTTHICI